MEKQLTTFLGHKPNIVAYKVGSREPVGEYISQSEAQRKLGLGATSHISEVLNGKKDSYCGYVFEYVYNA